MRSKTVIKSRRHTKRTQVSLPARRMHDLVIRPSNIQKKHLPQIRARRMRTQKVVHLVGFNAIDRGADDISAEAV